VSLVLLFLIIYGAQNDQNKRISAELQYYVVPIAPSKSNF